MADTAKPFMHGRSKAVRIPKQYRFAGTEVKVSRDGDEVLLEPVDKPFDVVKWREELRSFGSEEFLPEGAPTDGDLLPIRDIDLD